MLDYNLFDPGDQFLLQFINKKLIENYGLDSLESNKWIMNSALPSLLKSNPTFVHHKDPLQIVKMVADNNVKFPKRTLANV